MRVTVGSATMVLLLGDITLQDTDAIVNAANSGLMGGGGVDGAIHRAGGAQILAECKAIRSARGGCPSGEAVMTSGGKLNTRHVIHAVGPVWCGGSAQEDQLLRNAYYNSLCLAVEHKLRTVAFPSISTGVYGFPVEQASRIAFMTVTEFVRTHPQLQEVRFIVFSQNDFDVYARLFTR
jgi:O-acetyl-ADP-ribose deacetylase (regulator of RNase III)